MWALTNVASKSKINGPCSLTGDNPAAQARARAWARASLMLPSRSASTESMTREAVGVEATAPKRPGWSRKTARSERQSPPSAKVRATSSRTRPGSWRRARRTVGESALLSAPLRPVYSAISANNRVPAWAATPLPSAVTDNGGRGLVRFTLEVPFSRGLFDASQHQVSQRRRAFPRLSACVHATFMKHAG